MIAEDVVQRTKAALIKNNFAADTPLYVSETNKQPFDKAFRNYVIAHLVANDLVVSTQAEDALMIEYDAQVIRHGSVIESISSGYKPGMATAGVAGFWVLRDVFRGSTERMGYKTLGLAVAADAYHAVTPSETSVEMLLTTSITNNNRYLMLNADAYYIEKGEAWLFEGCKGRNRRLCR